jgi:hypothetical protein
MPHTNTNDIETLADAALLAARLLIALKAALPLLIQLGDSIGNANVRCHVVLAAREAIAEAEAPR